MATLATFLEAAEHAPSEYWRHILLDAGHGKFPMFYTFRDGNLLYRSKRKNAKTDKLVCPRDPVALAVAVQQFLRQTSGIMSNDDRYQYAHGQDDIIPTKWSQVKTHAQQKALIEQYVVAICREKGLSERHHARVMQIISIGFVLNVFPEVHLSPGGTITHIDGLLYNDETRKFYFHKPKTKQRKPVETDVAYEDEQAIYDSIWVKPWVRLLRQLFKLSDDGPGSSIVPSTVE